MNDPTLTEAEHAVAILEEQIDKRGRRGRRNQQVFDACAIPLLVALFVNRLLSNPGDVHESLRWAVRNDAAYVKIFGRIGTLTGDFATSLLAFDQVKEPAVEMANRLTDLADELLGELAAALDAFDTAVKAKAETATHLARKQNSALRMARGIRMRVEARQQIQRFERRLLESLPEAVATRQERARRHYAAIEQTARRAADKLRVTVMVLLGGATVSILALGFSADTPLVSEVLFVLATVPVLLLAGYLAMESAWYRATQRWARELAASDRLPPLPASGDAEEPGEPEADGGTATQP